MRAVAALQSATPEPAHHFRDALVGIIFPRTTARAYPAMLALAARAMRHVEISDGGTVFHLAAFDRGEQPAQDAIALIQLASKLRGFQLFTGGRVNRNAIRAIDVLECYSNAEACSSRDAWCQQVTRAPFRRESASGRIEFRFSADMAAPAQRPLWLFPCRFVLEGAFWAEPHHPASYEDQIEAAGIKRGCAWCPNFSPRKLCVIKETTTDSSR